MQLMAAAAILSILNSVKMVDVGYFCLRHGDGLITQQSAAMWRWFCSAGERGIALNLRSELRMFVDGVSHLTGH